MTTVTVLFASGARLHALYAERGIDSRANPMLSLIVGVLLLLLLLASFWQ